MSDEQRDDNEKVDDADAQQEPQAASDALAPKEAFLQGVNLLWHAARGALGGLKKELEKADIPGGLRSAAEEMKKAADAALSGKTREHEPDWVPPAEQGARIETDDDSVEPPADASTDEPSKGD
jgi:hypothetical protein